MQTYQQGITTRERNSLLSPTSSTRFRSVSASFRANTVANNLTGKAYEISCKIKSSDYAGSSKTYFMEDYGYVMQNKEGDLAISGGKIVSQTIE